MMQQNEKLSAVVDGELLDDTLLKALKNNPELIAKWQSYHLIRDTLRNELPPQVNFDISAKVMAALEDEPAILAPQKTWRDLPMVNNVIPLFRQGGQYAIAASVAVAMILGVQQLNQSPVEQPFNPALPLSGIQGGLSPVSLEQTRALPRTSMVDQRQLINAYLTDHQQQLRLKSSQIDEKKTKVEDKEKENIEKTPN
jgi:sigma-E factor negative regulatory protein RseA